jgi:hypothetical protein
MNPASKPMSKMLALIQERLVTGKFLGCEPMVYLPSKDDAASEPQSAASR